MSLAPSENRYDALLRVTWSPFREYEYIAASAPDEAEAVRRCKEAAAKKGWQSPAWWQWWRREDSREPFTKMLRERLRPSGRRWIARRPSGRLAFLLR